MSGGPDGDAVDVQGALHRLILPALAVGLIVLGLLSSGYARGWGVIGLVLGCIWIWRTLQRLERRVAALDEKYERRGQLLSTLAHELRTPLTVIRSSARILLDRNGG